MAWLRSLGSRQILQSFFICSASPTAFDKVFFIFFVVVAYAFDLGFLCCGDCFAWCSFLFTMWTLGSSLHSTLACAWDVSTALHKVTAVDKVRSFSLRSSLSQFPSSPRSMSDPIQTTSYVSFVLFVSQFIVWSPQVSTCSGPCSSVCHPS